MYKIIADEKELAWFYTNIVQDLKPSEVHFISLSARNKYLSKENQKELSLGRTEMFERRIIRVNDWIRFLRTIRKFETNEGSYTTKTGKNIPNRAVVCYFNINPSDTLKAYRDFNKVINEYMYELAQCSVNDRDTENIMYRLSKMPTTLMNAYQKATGTRYWIDFDFDVPKDFLPIVETLVKEIESRSGRAFIIDTKGGFHLLVSKNAWDEDGKEIPLFTSDFNPKTIVEDAMVFMEDYYDNIQEQENYIDRTTFFDSIEIMHNKNAMVPLPGTFQGGHKVIVLNKSF